MHRRSREEIKASILEFTLEPRLKTHILCHVVTTFEQLDVYLLDLVRHGLLKIADHDLSAKDSAGAKLGRRSRVKFVTTERGKLWLGKWKELQQV